MSEVKLRDRQGREIRYMRFSVTDRCNFRCRYCTPRDQFEQLRCQDLLRYEDLLFVASVAAKLGVERIRVTGGEPLVRKGIIDFLAKLAATAGVKEVNLTTNGSLLTQYAQSIYDAGVRRLNISLDSLQEERFRYISGGFSAQKTIDAIKFAKSIGFGPIKVNCVLVKDFNDDEIIDFCNFAAKEDVIVRFIEFMPIGNSPDWKRDNILTGKEILERIGASFATTALPKDINTGPARNYKLANGATIGVITPMSEHFCVACDKLRLTSDGKIRPCLLSDKEISVADAVIKRDEAALIGLFKASLGLKDDAHNLNLDTQDDFKRTMSKIGG